MPSLFQEWADRVLDEAEAGLAKYIDENSEVILNAPAKIVSARK